MSKTCDFIKECGVFYVLSMKENFPTGRPFGAIMEDNGKLYISTGDKKEVFKQLCANGSMCIVALKAGTRDWIRVKGKATECKDLHMKQKMLDDCPFLLKRFKTPDCEGYALFEIEVMESELHLDQVVEIIE